MPMKGLRKSVYI